MAPTVDLEEPRFARFEPALNSGTAARRFVSRAATDWGCDTLLEDIALCISELATNAVLHTRAPFQVGVRRTADGVRLEVVDTRPEAPPSPVPRHGTAIDVTMPSITGRGLQIVSNIASRWGYNITTASKAVWAELSAEKPGNFNPPVVVDTRIPDPAGSLHLQFLAMPVRTAIASGIQVDEMVREMQLGALDEALTAADKRQLYELLDRSAQPRLEGRYAAFGASAAHHERFDFDLETTPDSISAMAELGQLLESLLGQGALGARAPSSAVLAVRAWLLEESLSQMAGKEPRRCPLPA